MKTFKQLVLWVVRNEVVWNLFDKTILRFVRYLQWERNIAMMQTMDIDIDEIVQKISPQLIVRHGVFAGLKYPDKKSAGSALIPKLLGSYEKEIQFVLEEVCSTDYTEIVDIGCAEGYYAVGLAMRIPTATVFAFDIDLDALDLCGKMAQLNGVSERVLRERDITKEILKALPITGKAFIISDCEGCEESLFTRELVPYLAHHDLLIETHDFTSKRFIRRIHLLFEQTHHIQELYSIDDKAKPQLYRYPELDNFDLETQRQLLAEHRGATMVWLYLKAKN